MDENKIINELNKEQILQQDYVVVPATKRTPKVVIAPEEGYFSLEGRSFPSNAKSFYYPIFSKIDEYLDNPKDLTKVTFKLEYIDSSSTQLILSFINKLKMVKEQGKSIEVDWIYMQEDDDIKDMGKSFSDSSGLDFHFTEETDEAT
jgi:hypothetical protein